MKRCLFVKNGFLKLRSFDELYKSFEQAARLTNVELTVLTNDQLRPFTAEIGAFDFVLFWDKDVRLAYELEKIGLPVYNSAMSIALCDDKTLTYLALKDKLPMPKTILCPAAYYGYTDYGFLDRVESELGFPYIMKEGQGSFGQQVYLIHSRAEAVERLGALRETPCLFQRFIKEANGCDKRIYVVNGHVAAAMLRKAPDGDFRSNINGGGTAEKCTLSADEERMAIDATKALGLTFGGVDILMSKEGPLICEVNSNAHFTALNRIAGTNIAALILEALSSYPQGAA